MIYLSKSNYSHLLNLKKNCNQNCFEKTILMIQNFSCRFRVRPDKKAMRNSLVRFGKRANVPEKAFDEEFAAEPRFFNNGDYVLPERLFFRRFQEYN